MKRGYLLIFMLTGAALCVLLGIYLGRTTSRGLIAEKPIPSQTVVEKTEKDAQNSKDGQINLNTATLEQLQTLPKIGRKTAEAIISYRETIGAFSSKEQLMEVRGIGEKTYLELEDRITVE